MDIPNNQILSKAAICKELKISRARYAQFVESGILPQAFEITPGSRAVHTRRHVELARLNLDRLAMRRYNEIERVKSEQGYKPIKPLKPLKPNEQSKTR